MAKAQTGRTSLSKYRSQTRENLRDAFEDFDKQLAKLNKLVKSVQAFRKKVLADVSKYDDAKLKRVTYNRLELSQAIAITIETLESEFREAKNKMI